MLNSRLYERMTRGLAKPLKVVREGEELTGYYVAELVVDKETRAQKKVHRLVVTQWGEMYTCDCPYCGDTRGRMAVSYRYGQYDATTEGRLFGLWKCFNEDCQEDPAYWRSLMLTLSVDRIRSLSEDRTVYCDDRLKNVKEVKQGTVEPVELPGVTVPLTELPADHPAITYLLGRQPEPFLPAELVRTWNVGYCIHVPLRQRASYCQYRIIVPVYLKGILGVVQGRYVGEADWKLEKKYLNYGPKTQVLYGFDQVGDAPLVAVVEGVTDVWRYGPGAVASLGKGCSATQLGLLSEVAAGRPVVWVPDGNDPDAMDYALHDAGRFCRHYRHKGPVGICPIPEGKDPGGIARAELRARVAYATQFCQRWNGHV